MASHRRFDIDSNFTADCDLADKARSGRIYHLQRHATGSGMTLTPVAYYFAWRPSFTEGYNSYWRIDCVVGSHKLAPDPTKLGEALIAALIREKLCAEPIYLAPHKGEELKGKTYGQVYSDD